MRWTYLNILKPKKNLLLTSYIKSMDNVELRGRVECGRRHLRQCHPTTPVSPTRRLTPQQCSHRVQFFSSSYFISKMMKVTSFL